MVLEAKSPRSWCRQRWLFLRALRVNVFSASCLVWVVCGCLCVSKQYLDLCHLHAGFSLCESLSKCPLFIRTPVILGDGPLEWPHFHLTVTSSQVAQWESILLWCRRHMFDPWIGRSPGEGNGNSLQCSSLKFPWTEEPGGLQSMGSQRIGDNLATKQQTTKNYICNNPISKQDHILRYWG